MGPLKRLLLKRKNRKLKVHLHQSKEVQNLSMMEAAAVVPGNVMILSKEKRQDLD